MSSYLSPVFDRRNLSRKTPKKTIDKSAVDKSAVDKDDIPSPLTDLTHAGIPKLTFDDYSTSFTSETLQTITVLDHDILATAFSQGFDVQAIEDYITRFRKQDVKDVWDKVVENRRVFTYALDTGNVDIIELCLRHGANPNSTDFGEISRIAFVSMRALKVGHATPEVTRLLLSYGANPNSLPREMWENFLEQPEADEGRYGVLLSLAARGLDLTTRYYLWQAAHIQQRLQRMVQIAEAHKMTALLQLPYQIVGQELASRLVVNTVFAHIAEDMAKPLVLAFAGLSGDGKTELATQLGSMLSIPTETIDCAGLMNQTSLFGMSAGYYDNHNGTPLNNFLVKHQGKRCIVFLDEFEKTKKGVHNALLKVMDDGGYRDRRGNHDSSMLDCKKVIWILATNSGDATISRFYDDHLARCKPEDVGKVSIERLQTDLKTQFTAEFSAAVTGRINAIAPFFPFSPGEQAVVAHKFLRDMQAGARQAVSVDEKKLIGHADIAVVDDGRVCAALGKKSYQRDLGARSIREGVRDLRCGFVLEYANTDDLVTDAMNEGARQKFFAQVSRRRDGSEEVVLVRAAVKKRKRARDDNGAVDLTQES